MAARFRYSLLAVLPVVALAAFLWFAAPDRAWAVTCSSANPGPGAVRITISDAPGQVRISVNGDTKFYGYTLSKVFYIPNVNSGTATWSAIGSFSCYGTQQVAAWVPRAPAALYGTRVNSAGMRVSWPAIVDNGTAVSGHEYRYKITTDSDWGGWTATGSTDNYVTISSLNASNRYNVAVRGLNSQGNGTAVAAELPTAYLPQIIGQNINGNVVLSWNSPTPAPAKYQVLRTALAASLTPSCPAADDASYSEISTSLTRPTALTYTDPGPATNTRYCYRVRGQYVADDANVYGALSNAVLITLGAITIPPPEPASAAASAASSKSLSVSWSAQPTALLYRLQWKSGAESYDSSRELTALFPPLIIPDLQPNTAYTLRIRAEAGAANSDWSSDITATTNTANTPGQPNSLRLVGRDENSLSFTWNVAADADHPVTEWIINYRTVGSNTWTELTASSGVDGAAIEYTIPTLSPGVGYQVRVQGRNDIGLGGWSIIRAFVTATNPFESESPANLKAVAGEKTAIALPVSLSWDDMATATSYRVTRVHRADGQPEDRAALTTTDTSYADTVSVTEGVQGTVEYHVQGVGSGGSLSGMSNAVNVAYFWDFNPELPTSLASIGSPAAPHPDPTVQAVRDSFRNAAEIVGDSGGFDADGQGLLNLLVGGGCLIVITGSAYTGQRFRQTPLAMGFGTVAALFIMGLGVSWLNFPAIWMVFTAWGILGVGMLGLYRLVMQERIPEAQGYLAILSLALAAHASLAIAQSLAGYAITGEGEYDGILAGTPLGHIIGIAAPESITDIPGMFKAVLDVFRGLAGIVTFNYPILDLATGAASWIAGAVVLAATVGQAMLALFIARILFSSGILNSTAGMIAVGVISASGAIARLLGLGG